MQKDFGAAFFNEVSSVKKKEDSEDSPQLDILLKHLDKISVTSEVYKVTEPSVPDLFHFYFSLLSSSTYLDNAFILASVSFYIGDFLFGTTDFVL